MTRSRGATRPTPLIPDDADLEVAPSGLDGGPPPPPLLVTADHGLREEVLRLAAAAGVAPRVVDRPEAALSTWTAAPLVLVGLDAATTLAGLAPSRRGAVHLVGWGPVPDQAFRTAVDLGAQQVVDLPTSEGWLVELLTDVGEAQRVAGRVVGVVGGSGGAGATTLACGLGQVAAWDGTAVVLDCDPGGPGADRVLGLEDHDGIRWEALCRTTGRLSSRALRDAVPRRGDRRGGSVGALTWQAGSVATLQAFAVREALSAARRGHDTVVVDLARGAGALTGELMTRCDEVLLVVVPTLAGVSSAARLRARYADRVTPGLVVRGSGADPREVQRAVGAPVVAVMAEQRGVAEAIDLGLGPVRSRRGPLARTCVEILAGLHRAPHVAAGGAAA